MPCGHSQTADPFVCRRSATAGREMEVPRLRHLRDALHTGNVDVAQAWAAMEADFDDDEEDVRPPAPIAHRRGATASLRSSPRSRAPSRPMERSPRRSLGAGAGPQPGAGPLRLPGQPAQRALGLRPHPVDAAKGPPGPGLLSLRASSNCTAARNLSKSCIPSTSATCWRAPASWRRSAVRTTNVRCGTPRVRLHAVTHLAHDERQIRGVLTKVTASRWHKFRHLHKRTG